MTAIEEDLADKQRKVGQLEEQSSKVRLSFYKVSECVMAVHVRGTEV